MKITDDKEMATILIAALIFASARPVTSAGNYITEVSANMIESSFVNAEMFVNAAEARYDITNDATE